MVFDVVQQEEGEDFYIVTLSIRPEGDFNGRPGQEQFFIEKEGNVAHRQVLSLPRRGKGGFPKLQAGIGIVIAAIAVFLFLVFFADDKGKDQPPPEATTPATQPASTTQPTKEPATQAPAITLTPTNTLPPTVSSEVVQNNEVVQTNDDHGDFMETASFIVEGGNPGVIDYPNDFDYFKFSARAGETFSIEVELDTHPDTNILLFDQDGVFLGENNDFEGLGRGSGMVFEAPFDGNFFVEVRSLNQSADTGSYNLYFTFLGDSQTEDDHGNVMETASFIEEGKNSGVIDYPEDLDYFHFSVESGDVFAIEVELETHPNTVVVLFDENGEFLGENDDFEGLGRGSGIIYAAPFGGEYFVKVYSWDQGSDTGSYNLYLTYLTSVSSADDHGSTIEAATEMGPGSIFGELETPEDLDFFRIFSEANSTYVAEVALESHPNTGLTLMDRNGTPIQENDDAQGLNGGSRIIWRTPPIETEYVLKVNSMDSAGGTGSYILYVEPIPDQHGNSMALATEIIPGNNYFGLVSPSDDLDFFRFSAQAGESYVIEAVLDGHPDTVLTLYQARGLQVDANDDGEGMDGGSRLNWTAPSSGDYFIPHFPYG